MEWVDEQLKADPRLAREVDETLDEMRLEQDLAALREESRLSQRQVAQLLGTSERHVAKLERRRVKDFTVGTLARYARALGGTVSIQAKANAPRAIARCAEARRRG